MIILHSYNNLSKSLTRCSSVKFHCDETRTAKRLATILVKSSRRLDIQYTGHCRQ